MFCGDTASAFPCLKVCNGDASAGYVCPLDKRLRAVGRHISSWNSSWGGELYIPGAAMVQGAGL